MSQMEHSFRQYLSKHPEIERCYATGLINRRALARYLIKEGLAKVNQLEALVAMLRRYPFQKSKQGKKDLMKNIRVTIKDDILLLTFDKQKELLEDIKQVISHTNYDQGDTLKIVLGSSAVKLFIDRKNEKKLSAFLKKYKVQSRQEKISEMSLLFPPTAQGSKGIISALTTEFTLHDIIFSEILTASPELLVYVEEKYVLKAYEVLKDF